MQVSYRKATLKDIADMQSLIAPEVESGVILARSDDECATNIRSYILAYIGNELVGFCALHIHTATLAEIRSLIVKEDKRGYKIGKNLVLNSIKEAKALDLKQ
ncbi:MAG: GNAT family N-acetyltransferase, partial [Campylobacterales bacterium]